jgi:hypothetical protein
MPPKRTRELALNTEPRESPSEAQGLDALLQTVYHDLRVAHAQFSNEQARNRVLEIELAQIREQMRQFQADRASKEAENARLQIEVARLQSQLVTPSPLTRTSQPQDSNTYVFKLEKAAKSSGGDKFVCVTQPEFNIYFPQTISRQDRARPSQLLHLRVDLPADPAPTSPSFRHLENSLNEKKLNIRNGMKEELVSGDDDEPIVLSFIAGGAASRSLKSSA